MSFIIRNAADIPLSENVGTLPNVSASLLDWFQPVAFTRLKTTVINYQAVETRETFFFEGVVQPFTSQQLQMKPEGQRQWKWQWVHALPSLILAPDELITYQGVQYRVKGKTDYKEYGYVAYELGQDYKP